MTQTQQIHSKGLLRQIACPHCWRAFKPESAYFISEGAGLLGDPVLGPNEQLRFRAMRFDTSGNALDPEDARCTRVACPECHVELPRRLLEVPTTSVSVVGAPGSGKTNLLASGLWMLSHRGDDIGCGVVDTDPGFNVGLHSNQATLFMRGEADRDVTLPKTAVRGRDAYWTARVRGNEELLPRANFFSLSHRGHALSEALVLYDNAGEHYLPTQDASVAEISTRHLERSHAIVMVFDPLQNQGFREQYCGASVSSIATGHQRQELVLSEVVSRVRRVRGLDPSTPVSIPLIIALTKADEWAPQALGSDWATTRGPCSAQSSWDALAAHILRNHRLAKAAMQKVAAELVRTAELLAETVLFVPASALGTSPRATPTGEFVIPSKAIRPQWAEMPLVAAIATAHPTLYPIAMMDKDLHA